MPPQRRRSSIGADDALLQPSLLRSLAPPTATQQLPAWAARVRERLGLIETQLRRLEREKQGLLGQLLESPADLVDAVLAPLHNDICSDDQSIQFRDNETVGGSCSSTGKPRLWEASRGLSTVALLSTCGDGAQLHPKLHGSTINSHAPRVVPTTSSSSLASSPQRADRCARSLRPESEPNCKAFSPLAAQAPPGAGESSITPQQPAEAEILCATTVHASETEAAGDTATQVSCLTEPEENDSGRRCRSPSLAVTVRESSDEECGSRETLGGLPDEVAAVPDESSENDAHRLAVSDNSNDTLCDLPWLHRPPASPLRATASSSLLERIQRRRSASLQENCTSGECPLAIPTSSEIPISDPHVDTSDLRTTAHYAGGGSEHLGSREAICASEEKPARSHQTDDGLNLRSLEDDALKGWMRFFGMKPVTSREFMIRRLQAIEDYIFGVPAKSSVESSAAGGVLAGRQKRASAKSRGGRGQGRGRARKRALKEDSEGPGDSVASSSCRQIEQSPKAARRAKATEKAEALDQALADAIRSDTELYEQLLLFEPVELSEIRSRLATNPHHPELASLSEQRLRSFLDSQGMVFASTWNAGARQAHHRRF